MRPQLFDPTATKPALERALILSEQIYRLIEGGQDYSGPLRELALVAQRPVGAAEALAAFGSVSPQTFARKQLVDWNNLPSDVTQREMLELVERVMQAKGTEFQMEYWLACLRVNTGDDNIVGLIFWPGEYFGDGDDSREMSTSAVLETALRAGQLGRGT